MRVRPARPTRSLAALMVGAGLLAACASGQPPGTSFTSLSAAEAQAHTWVDGAVKAAAPPGASASSTALPGEACDSASGRSSARYEVKVKTTKDDVDATTLAVWRALAGQGFTLAAANAPASGTDPAPPGPSAPSWTVSGSHDGFSAEVVGNRADPGVRVWVATPCFGT